MKTVVKITFLAKGIKEVKQKINSKYSVEYQAERFRNDMLAKHDLLFKKEPHVIKTEINLDI